MDYKFPDPEVIVGLFDTTDDFGKHGVYRCIAFGIAQREIGFLELKNIIHNCIHACYYGYTGEDIDQRKDAIEKKLKKLAKLYEPPAEPTIVTSGSNAKIINKYLRQPLDMTDKSWNEWTTKNSKYTDLAVYHHYDGFFEFQRRQKRFAIRISSPSTQASITWHKDLDPPYLPDQFEYTSYDIYIVAHKDTHDGMIKGTACTYRPAVSHCAYTGSCLIKFENEYIIEVSGLDDFPDEKRYYTRYRDSQDQAIADIGTRVANFRKHRARAVRLFQELQQIREGPHRCPYKEQVSVCIVL